MNSVIIAGSRNINNYDLVLNVVKEYQKLYGKIEEIISGRAKGVDSVGETVANKNNIDLVIFPANWGKFSKQAGYIRNKKMAEYSAWKNGGCIVIHNNSPGSLMMVKLAKEYKLTLLEKVVE